MVLHILKEVVHKLTVLFVAVLSCILFPLIVIVLSPIYILRLIISYSSKYFRPDLGKMVTTNGTFTAADDMYSKPECNLTICFEVKGEVDLVDVRNKIAKIVETRGKDQELKYPELKQSICSWMGFLFWKNDNAFDVNNHVRYFNYNGDSETFPETEISEDEYKRAVVDLVQHPHSVGRSPWSFVIFRNYKPKGFETSDEKYSLISWQQHHAIADGYAVIKLVSRELAQNESLLADLPKPKTFMKKERLTMLLVKIWTYMKMPFDVASFLMRPNDANHGWRKSESDKTGQLIFGKGKSLKLDEVKQIKSNQQVSLSSALLAGVAGGVRNMMVQQGHKLPKFIKLATPWPVPNHPDKLRNHMVVGLIEIPIAEEDSIKRLQIIDKNFKQIARSSVPLVLFYGSKLLGGLFAVMIKSLTKFRFCTGLMSNFPGFANTFVLLGHEVEDAYFGGGLLRGEIGIILNCLTYKKQMRFTVMADTSVIPEEKDMDQLLSYIEEELLRLRHCLTV